MNEEQLRELQEELKRLVLILLFFDCANEFSNEVRDGQSMSMLACYFCIQLVMFGVMLYNDPDMSALIEYCADLLLSDQIQEQIACVFDYIFGRPENHQNDIGGNVEGAVAQGMNQGQNPAMAGIEEPIPDPEGGGGEWFKNKVCT
ncbi:hypothetical protein EDL81_04055 [Ehrlichia ruminantium]|uniref:Uncharacterized protein n=1 Tax=Ehrlichia ruminantium TaxID=779 RepID=A0AAE6QAX3_EHRRU|nr:hypothetical protein [Ehrlichia ruminantium]QGR02790.1 hypothetical protein EDL81_04055 [Ehrlichia ruminantium]QGR03712.1 hypothetical protein EDL80_04055 [Ehrlichia ruminantium]